MNVSSLLLLKGNEWWSEVSIRLSNQCGQAIELQNATINFVSHENINTSFWGEFGNIAYPINLLQITSQPSGTNYIASLSLQMPSEEWSNTQLAQGQSITIQYGLPFSPKTYEPNSVKVYLQGEVEQASSLLLVNQTTKPDGVEQSPVGEFKKHPGF